jgi:PAS domain S-box-containing protein
MENLNTKNSIKTTIARFNNFPPLQSNNYNTKVCYFWESHRDNPQDSESIVATSNLLHRIDLSCYEKYEVYTGYLSRWNYMYKNFDEMSKEEIEETIHKGYEEQEMWLKRCQPDLQDFMTKDWKDCISEKENPHYQNCRQLILEKLKDNRLFSDAFYKSVNSYADRHKTSKKNGEQYVLEEISWIFSLPFYLIHVREGNPAIKEMFRTFSVLKKVSKWLSPRIREVTFKNDTDFLMYYNVNHAGYSYLDQVLNLKKSASPSQKSPISFMEVGYMENVILQHIIEKLPCHVYWLNRENVYLGCNEEQAKDFGLKSKDEIKGKTNFDFHDHSTAVKLNEINEFVMSTGKPYEGEEPANINGTVGECLSTKIPLFDVQGKIVGLLGISFDITDRKRAEWLTIKKNIRNELYEIGKEVTHEIWAPLPTLGILHYGCKDKLCEQEREMLEWAIQKLREVSDMLLKRYRQTEIDKDDKGYLEFKKYLSVYDYLYEGIDKK